LKDLGVDGNYIMMDFKAKRLYVLDLIQLARDIFPEHAVMYKVVQT
jgi:hypothetical protein